MWQQQSDPFTYILLERCDHRQLAARGFTSLFDVALKYSDFKPHSFLSQQFSNYAHMSDILFGVYNTVCSRQI
jgi:hypothetical protein